MVNKRWKKTLSIMLSAAMVFSMNNVAFAAKQGDTDGGISARRYNVEREREVFPEPIKGEVVGSRPDSVVRKGAKGGNGNVGAIGDYDSDYHKFVKSEDYTATLTLADDDTYYAIEDDNDEPARFPFFAYVDIDPLNTSVSPYFDGYVYMDLTINDQTLTLEGQVDSSEGPVLFKVSDLNNTQDDYQRDYKSDYDERSLGIEAGKTYDVGIKVYEENGDFIAGHYDENDSSKLIDDYYEHEIFCTETKKITFKEDSVNKTEPYVNKTKYVDERAAVATAQVIIPYGLDDYYGNGVSLELLDKDNKVVGRSRVASVGTTLIGDEQYTKYGVGFTRNVSYVYGDVHFFEYLDGTYDLMATVNNHTYTVADAVKTNSLKEPYVDTVDIENNTFDSANGDYVYVFVDGVNLDPDKIVPYISQSDNIKEHLTSDTPEAVIAYNDGFVYKLKKTADITDYDVYDENGKFVETSREYPLNVRATDASYEVELAYAEEGNEDNKVWIAGPSARIKEPVYNWKTNKLEIKANLYSGDKNDLYNLKAGDTVTVAINRYDEETKTLEPIRYYEKLDPKTGDLTGYEFAKDTDIVKTVTIPDDGLIEFDADLADNEEFCYAVVKEADNDSHGYPGYWNFDKDEEGNWYYEYRNYSTAEYCNYEEESAPDWWWDASEQFYALGATTLSLDIGISEEKDENGDYVHEVPEKSELYPALFDRNGLVEISAKPMTYKQVKEDGQVYGNYTMDFTLSSPLSESSYYHVRYYKKDQDPLLRKDVNGHWPVHYTHIYAIDKDNLYVNGSPVAEFATTTDGRLYLDVNVVNIDHELVSGNNALKVWKDGNYEVEIFDRNGEAVKGWTITGYQYGGDYESSNSGSSKSSSFIRGFTLRIEGLATEDVTGYFVRVTKDGREPVLLSEFNQTGSHGDRGHKSYYEVASPLSLEGIGEFTSIGHEFDAGLYHENINDPHAYCGLYATELDSAPAEATVYDRYELTTIATITADEKTLKDNNGDYYFTASDLDGVSDEEIFFVTLATPFECLAPAIGYVAVNPDAEYGFDDLSDRVIPEVVSLNDAGCNLAIGESVKLDATVTPEESLNKDVEWTTDDESVATVDKDGNVEAIATGIANIKATAVDGGAYATCQITVIAVNLDKKTASIEKGSTLQLKATVSPDAATDEQKAVTYSSSDEKIAKVDEKGLVTGVGVGKATITASSNLVPSANACEITVTEATAETAPIAGIIEPVGEVTIGGVAYTVSINKSALTYTGGNLKKYLKKALIFIDKKTGQKKEIKSVSAKAKKAGEVILKKVVFVDKTKLKASDLSGVKVEVAPREVRLDTMKNANGAYVFAMYNASKSKTVLKNGIPKKIRLDVPNFKKDAEDLSEASLDPKKPTKTITVNKKDIASATESNGGLTIVFQGNFKGTITIK